MKNNYFAIFLLVGIICVPSIAKATIDWQWDWSSERLKLNVTGWVSAEGAIELRRNWKQDARFFDCFLKRNNSSKQLRYSFKGNRPIGGELREQILKDTGIDTNSYKEYRRKYERPLDITFSRDGRFVAIFEHSPPSQYQVRVIDSWTGDNRVVRILSSWVRNFRWSLNSQFLFIETQGKFHFIRFSEGVPVYKNKFASNEAAPAAGFWINNTHVLRWNERIATEDLLMVSPLDGIDTRLKLTIGAFDNWHGSQNFPRRILLGKKRSAKYQWLISQENNRLKVQPFPRKVSVTSSDSVPLIFQQISSSGKFILLFHQKSGTKYVLRWDDDDRPELIKRIENEDVSILGEGLYYPRQNKVVELPGKAKSSIPVHSQSPSITDNNGSSDKCSRPGGHVKAMTDKEYLVTNSKVSVSYELPVFASNPFEVVTSGEIDSEDLVSLYPFPDGEKFLGIFADSPGFRYEVIPTATLYVGRAQDGKDQWDPISNFELIEEPVTVKRSFD